MLQIEVENEFLDLPVDFAPEFNRFSPVFQTEGVIKDDYTFPIPLPHTDRNARILGNPGVIENETSFRPRFTAKLWWNGMPRITGQIRISKVDSDRTISVYFAYGLSEISVDFRTRSLRDIMDEEIVIHNTNFDKSIVLWYIGISGDLAEITINGKAYSESTVADLIDAINDDPDQSASAEDVSVVIESLTFTYVKIIPGSANELEPFNIQLPRPAINAVTEQLRPIWEAVTPTFTTTYSDTYKDFVDNYRGVDPDRKLRFLTYANFNGFDNDSNIKDFPLVNGYNADGLLRNFLRGYQVFLPNTDEVRIVNQTSLAPQVTIRYILEKIEIYYGIKIIFPMTAENTDGELVLLSPMTLDVPLKYFNDQKLIFYRRSFNINEFVPDIPVNDFLKALQSIGFYITYDPVLKIVEFKEKQPIVRSPRYFDLKNNYSDLFEVVNFQKEGVTLSHESDPDDTFIQDTFSPYSGNYNQVFGAGEKKINTRISVPHYDGFAPFPSDIIATSGVVVSMQRKPEFKSVKLAYQEYTEDTLTTFVVNGQSLAWESQLNFTDGLWEQYWKDWIVMEDNTTTCKATLYMREDWIWNPEWTIKYLIDRNKFLVKSFTVSLQESEWMEVEAELVKIPYSRRTNLDLGGPIVEIPAEGGGGDSGFDYEFDFELD
jgi:hypothetical protein